MKNWIKKKLFGKRDAKIDALERQLKTVQDDRTELEKRLAREEQSANRAMEKALEAVNAATVARQKLTKLEAERALVFRRPPEEMNEPQLRAAFDFSDDNPLWQAVHQVLDVQIRDQVDAMTPAPNATLTAEMRTHLAGGVDALRELQTELLRLHQRARQPEVETESKGSEG